MEPRAWSFSVQGSAPALGVPGFGQEPLTDTTFVAGLNFNVSGTIGTTPDGTHQTGIVPPGGPNAGLGYVTSQNYSMTRTFSVNRWFTQNWGTRNIIIAGTSYNPWEVESIQYQGNPMALLTGIANHEWFHPNSHQNKLIASAQSGCGNIAAYVEQVVADPSMIQVDSDGAVAVGAEWLAYEASEKFVNGIMSEYGVFRIPNTSNPFRALITDGIGSETQPMSACID